MADGTPRDENYNEFVRMRASLTNHPITQDGLIDAIETLRGNAINVAGLILDLTPPSRERSLALTHLEETVMWAVKAAVLHQT